MSASVGADIEAMCSKCGDVWHVVVAKVGPDIVKVQCKECHGYHRYRKPGAPAGGRKAKAASPARRATRPSGRGSSTTASSAAAITFRPDTSAPTRPYTMRETFRQGEQISHPRFGIGLVEQSSEPGKMAVLFADGRRVLAQAKPESTIGTANRIETLTAPEGED
jgi:hypothetical protein